MLAIAAVNEVKTNISLANMNQNMKMKEGYGTRKGCFVTDGNDNGCN
jgi:hypothetical protein